MRSVILLSVLHLVTAFDMNSEINGLSPIAWIFIGIAIVLVPIGLIIFGCFLERRFGIPKKERKMANQRKE